MAKNKLDDLLELINNNRRAGIYDLSSYKPDRKRMYRLDKINYEGIHIRVMSKFMPFNEMNKFLSGFLKGIESCS